jgi:predicted HTH transcriptional regulator
MKTDQLEEILETGAETQSVEFKDSCVWDLSIVKDILAMANVRQGGVIIIGLEEIKEPEGTRYSRKGVSPECRKTYEVDRMKDQVSNFADPFVAFTVDFPRDRDGKEYVTIEVSSFEEIPVVCKKDGKDLYNGKLYYRNRNRRVESAPVSNATDMREIIMLAASRMMKRLGEFGFITLDTDRKKFDDELEGL